MRKCEGQGDLFPLIQPGSLTTIPRLYLDAIGGRMEMLRAQGRRSWDAYREVFAPAYDEMRSIDIGEAIAVVCSFVESLTGERLEPLARSLIARGVRAHGKAIMYGYDQALSRVASPDPRDMHRYACAVARGAVSRTTNRSTDDHRTDSP